MSVPLLKIFEPEEVVTFFPPVDSRKTHKVLIVDDEPMMLETLKETLNAEGFETHTVADGRQALRRARQEPFALILADQRMPQMTGLELLAELKLVQPHTTRILITGAINSETLIDAINKGEIFRFLAKPWQHEDLLMTVRNGVQRYELVCRNDELRQTTLAMNEQLAALNRCLEEKMKLETIQNHQLSELNRALTRNFDRSVEMCFHTLQTFHPLLGQRTRRVVQFSRHLAVEANLPEDQRQVLETSAWLHEIGLMDLPSDLLQRWYHNPPSLSSAERELVEHHPVLGQEMASFVYQMADVGRVIRAHHERFDGEGFPDGLAGDEIPWLGRLLAVAASFAAQDLDDPEQVRILSKEQAGAFDPEAMRLLVNSLKNCHLPRKARPVALLELRPGMTLARDVCGPHGWLLLPAGTELCDAWIAHLRRYQRVFPIANTVMVHD